MASLNIISFNVNGVRAIQKKGFGNFLKKYQPDIICLQETKISDSAREQAKFDWSDFDEFWHSADRPGYSGTATLAKPNLKVVKVAKLPWDKEGRIQVLDLGKYYIGNIYFPNAQDDLKRLTWKMDWNNKLLVYLKRLDKQKPLIICGDYNVAHQEIDLARPQANVGSAGFTPQERAWLDKFLASGFKDTFRELNPQKIQYSWWSYRAGARSRNVGWRIDYFCVSNRILTKIKKAYILNEVLGSDHCPVGVEVEL